MKVFGEMNDHARGRRRQAWMGFEDTSLSEISQLQKDKYCA